MAERRRGLGRGLGALIPSAPQASELDGSDDPRGADVAVRTTSSRSVAVPDETRRAEATVAPDVPTAVEDAQPRQETAAPALPVAAGRPGRESVRTKRPVDVFFDGAPRSKGRGDDETATEESRSNAQEPRSPSGKNGRGRRTVSAEAMENALARGSRDGRALGPRSSRPTIDGPDSGPVDTGAMDRRSVPSSTVAEGDAASRPRSPGVAVEGDASSNGSGSVSRETLVEVPGAVFAEIPVAQIQPNPRQPRAVFDEDEMGELVHSIRTIGVLQPVVVRRQPGGPGFELVMGERRWRATQRAGLESIPAIVRSTDDTDMLRDALLENLHRSQLNPLEEAAAYQQLLDDFAATHDELATRIGRSRPQISNTLRLLQLPPLVQRRVAAGVLSAGHARALLALADVGEIEKLAQRIVSEGMSVRATEEAVALSDGLKRSPRNSAPRNTVRHERLDYLATSLSDYLDTSVKVSLGARKGKVSIEFGSVEDLNRIIDLISPDARG